MCVTGGGGAGVRTAGPPAAASPAGRHGGGAGDTSGAHGQRQSTPGAHADTGRADGHYRRRDR